MFCGNAGAAGSGFAGNYHGQDGEQGAGNREGAHARRHQQALAPLALQTLEPQPHPAPVSDGC
jgi:hypothetical protein